MQERSEQLGEEIADAREDWERKQADDKRSRRRPAAARGDVTTEGEPPDRRARALARRVATRLEARGGAGDAGRLTRARPGR